MYIFLIINLLLLATSGIIGYYQYKKFRLNKEIVDPKVITVHVDDLEELLIHSNITGRLRRCANFETLRPKFNSIQFNKHVVTSQELVDIVKAHFTLNKSKIN